MVDKDKMLQELLEIVNNVDEFVENLDDEKVKDLLYKLNDQALKNMIQDTVKKGGPSKHDIDILIAIQSFKSQEQSYMLQKKVNRLTWGLIILTIALVFLTLVLVFLTYKLIPT